MIDINNPNVREVLLEIHNSMQSKAKRNIHIKDEIRIENEIFSIICHNFDIGPIKCAEEMNNRHGYSLTANDIIQVFRDRRMSHPRERKELFIWSGQVADLFAGSIAGDRATYEKFEKLRKEPFWGSGKKHESQERIAAIMIYEKYPEINTANDAQKLQNFGNTFAKYFFYDMSDAISNVYGLPQNRDDKKKGTSQQGKEMSYKQAMNRIRQLENTLERTNTMLQDLQDEFEEQLELSKIKELADFFARLNSEKYGCLLDELLVVRKGIDELKRNNYELPLEINGLTITIKKLIQFVRDCHIEPILKINSIKDVVASDIEFFNYEGTPFISSNDTKRVKVISPGWIYRDKEIQISRPKVKEEE